MADHRRFGRLLTIAVAAVAVLAPATVAEATTDSGNQNPKLAVNATLEPEVVTTGDSLSGYYSVVYKGEGVQKVRLCGALVNPSGTAAVACNRYVLQPGDTRTELISFKVRRTTERGTWALKTRATIVHRHHASRARATAQVI